MWTDPNSNNFVQAYCKLKQTNSEANLHSLGIDKTNLVQSIAAADASGTDVK